MVSEYDSEDESPPAHQGQIQNHANISLNDYISQSLKLKYWIKNKSLE